METIVSIILWMIFAGIPTVIVLVPSFFILKSKGLNRLSHYIVTSFIVGFLVVFLLRLSTYMSSGLIMQRSGDVQIISGGKVTIEGYVYFASQSLLGAILSSFIGLVWWYFGIYSNKAADTSSDSD